MQSTPLDSVTLTCRRQVFHPWILVGFFSRLLPHADAHGTWSQDPHADKSPYSDVHPALTHEQESSPGVRAESTGTENVFVQSSGNMTAPCPSAVNMHLLAFSHNWNKMFFLCFFHWYYYSVRKNNIKG